MIKVGLVGATGYAGQQLLWILEKHKEVEIVFLSSNSYEGKDISEIYKNYLSNIEPMLAWLKDIDPYGQKSWIFREHYQAITPVNLLLSMQINDIRERFLKKRRTSCL